MKFKKILEELKKGNKATREEWEKVKTYRYKYIKLEHGDCVAYLKDDTVRHKGEELTNWVGCVFGFADFTAEDWKVYKEPTKNWEPKEGEKYYYITTSGDVAYNTFNTSLDEYRLSFRNGFKTVQEARKMVEKIKIINKLRELSNTRSIYNQDKFIIYYNFQENKVSCGEINYMKVTPFEVYFKTREDCQKAIDTIGEDNLKKYYFDIAEVEEEK